MGTVFIHKQIKSFKSVVPDVPVDPLGTGQKTKITDRKKKYIR